MTSIQSIEGGSILAKLADTLFKGLGSILGEAAEFEEEMGVLKQINRITLEDEATDKTYTLTIKLSPVRNKDNLYYVEAETNAPNFDVSSLHRQTIELDKTNINSFNEKVKQLITKNNLQVSEPQQDQQSTKEESTAEKDEQQNSNLEIESQIDALLSEIKSYYDRVHPVGLTKKRDYATINVEITKADSETCTVRLDAINSLDKEAAPLSYIHPDSISIELIEDNMVISSSSLKAKIEEIVDDFAANNNIRNLRYVSGSTSVQVSFVKDKRTKQVSYTAIHASCDITSALDIIYDVAEDPDFVDSIPEEEEQSFEITEIDDSYDVSRIESVDVSDSYAKLYEKSDAVSCILQSYRRIIGSDRWYKIAMLDASFYLVNEMCDYLAQWMMFHDPGRLPYPGWYEPEYEVAFQNVQKGGTSCPDELVISNITAILSELLALADGYYVNFTRDEQSMIDQWITRLKSLLAYS